MSWDAAPSNPGRIQKIGLACGQLWDGVEWNLGEGMSQPYPEAEPLGAKKAKRGFRGDPCFFLTTRSHVTHVPYQQLRPSFYTAVCLRKHVLRLRR